MPRPSSFLSSGLLAAALLLALPCFAQSMAVRVIHPWNCPVELSAAHSGTSQLVHVAPGAPDPPKTTTQAAQSIGLSMKNTRLQRIVSAEIEVHGTPNRSRVVPIGAAASHSSEDAVRHVQLTSSVPPNQERTRTVSAENLTSVSYLSITELRYADGSVWSAGPGRACTVVPSGLMEVDNR